MSVLAVLKSALSVDPTIGVSEQQVSYRVPLLGEVIGVVEEEVAAIDMDEGSQAQVLGAIALLPHQLFVGTSHMEVLHTCQLMSQ